MKFEFDMKGMEGILKTLESLPAEIVSKRGGPVKNALRKAAHVIRDEEAKRFKGLVNQRGWNETTGLLEKSIIVKRGRPPIDVKGERYIVTFKRSIYAKSIASQFRKLGSSGGGETVTVRKTAQLFEYGSSHQPPRKFILPAFHAKAGEAIEVFKDDLRKRIDATVKKLAGQNRTRK